MTRHVGVWAILVALTATSATVTRGWSEDPARGAPREAQAPTAEELAAVREARFRTVWSAADAPHQAGDYAESERRYKQVLDEFPDSQRAALRVAIAQERQGKSAEALESYDRALAADPQGEWAPVALFYKARFCKEGAREPDARAAIARLRAEHPDSSYVARAAVLEAELDGRSTAAAESALERELAAAALYDAGMAKSKARADEEALEELRRVPIEFPGTAAALRALDAEGHILTRNRRFDEALVPFLRILEATQSAAPNARISETAATRVAALHHALNDRDAALQTYLDIAESEGLTSKTRANALLQGSGVYFEILQQHRRRDIPVSDQQWDEMRLMLITARDAQGATKQDVKIAELMHLETWHWQRRREETAKELDAFLLKYQGAEHRREIATARIFGAIDLNYLRRHEEAAAHIEWVMAEYKPDEWVWPTWKGLDRGVVELFKAKEKLGASRSELVRLAEFMEKHYSDYGPVQVVLARRPQWDEKLRQEQADARRLRMQSVLSNSTEIGVD